MFILRDNHPGNENNRININVSIRNNFLCIEPAGHGEYDANNGEGAPVFLELYDGILRIVISPNINMSDKQVISLDGAQEKYKLDMSDPARPPLVGTFIPQSWVNDYAVDIDGRYAFDLTKKVLSMSLDQLVSLKPYTSYTDLLCPDYERHSGPFEVEVDIAAWLVLHGINNMEDMTQADLDRLRQLYNIV